MPHNTKKFLLNNNIPWGVKRRLEFIELKIYWEGRLNRKNLMDHFNISVPQASSDLKKYQELAPTNLNYNKSGKFYYPSPEFKPVLTKPSPEHYLNQLFEMNSGRLDPATATISHLAPCYKTPIPSRSIDPEIFKKVLKAINDGLAIQILYQSLNRDSPIWRWISPVALGNDGFRWHIRAYCHKSNIFKDFVFGRIASVSDHKQVNITIEDDILWNTEIEFVIIAHPKMEESMKRVIENDYGMANGELKFSVKGAFTYYFSKRLGFKSGHEDNPPAEQHIILKNADQIKNFICSCNEKQKSRKFDFPEIDQFCQCENSSNS